MGQYRKAGFCRRIKTRKTSPARRLVRVMTATLIAAGVPFNLAIAADVSGTTQTPQRKTYDIPAGPLEATLNRFGREAGILLSFPSAITANRQSAGLRGEYDVPQAFGQILHGTGVASVQQANGGYTLVEVIDPGKVAARAVLQQPVIAGYGVV